MRTYLVLMTVAGVWFSGTAAVRAEVQPAPTPLPNPALIQLARQFVSSVSQKFAEADRAMGIAADDGSITLPEGEMLLFNIALPGNIVLENIITTEVHDGGLVISLRDYVAALEFPIIFENGKGEGWYIRESKMFHLDEARRSVQTEQGQFTLSDKVILRDDDVWVPVDELASWFGFTMKPQISVLQIALESPTRLPIEEKFARSQRKFLDRRQQAPELPFKAEEAKALEFPFVDVTTQTTYSRDGTTRKGDTQRSGTIASTGDFAYGTLTTQAQLNDQDRLASARATYKRESLQPELLGPLKARKYELGDINPRSQPLTDSPPAGLGAHITNADPLRSTLDATTGISGNALPGWDVELYRGNQILDIQTVGEDGRYNFDKVDLFSSDNNFRVVFYGPQGEVREENIYVPVNTNRLAKSGSAYDVTVTLDDTQTYRAQNADTEDTGVPRLSAQYEVPFNDASVAKLGLEAGQEDGKAEAIAHAGVSTTLMQTLFNANTAVDEAGEASAELVARRSFGDHKLRNTLEVATDHFNEDETDPTQDVFSNRFDVDGPFPLQIGSRPRYNLGLDFTLDNQGEDQTRSTAGFSTGFGRLSFSQQFHYALDDDTQLDSVTTLSGTVGRNRLRVTSDYAIKPERALENLRVNLQRSIGSDVNINVDVNRYVQQNLTEGTAQVNWQAGHALISPSISYNSNGDITAALNTRFGMMRDPQSGKVRMFNRPISLNGGLSVFVFLDENGNGLQDDGEEPIENAMIAAPQNGGRQETGKDGYVFFTGLEKLRLTDVYLEPDSLEDPYWLPTTRGVSVLPREGHLTQLTFPVLMAGEIEGTLFSRLDNGVTFPATNTAVTLYDHQGEKILGTVSADDGYYLLSPIAPGDYFMVVGNAQARDDGFVRPAPIPVSIGYDGPVISGQDIYMTQGLSDAPVRMLTSTDALQVDEPALDVRAIQDKTVILNLGTYRSRVLMGVMWYKTRLLQGHAVADMQALVAPADSYAAAQTGMHTLRIGMPDLTYANASKRCGALNAAGIKCTVEILPGGLQVAKI